MSKDWLDEDRWLNETKLDGISAEYMDYIGVHQAQVEILDKMKADAEEMAFTLNSLVELMDHAIEGEFKGDQYACFSAVYDASGFMHQREGLLDVVHKYLKKGD